MIWNAFAPPTSYGRFLPDLNFTVYNGRCFSPRYPRETRRYPRGCAFTRLYSLPAITSFATVHPRIKKRNRSSRGDADLCDSRSIRTPDRSYLFYGYVTSKASLRLIVRALTYSYFTDLSVLRLFLGKFLPGPEKCSSLVKRLSAPNYKILQTYVPAFLSFRRVITRLFKNGCFRIVIDSLPSESINFKKHNFRRLSPRLFKNSFLISFPYRVLQKKVQTFIFYYSESWCLVRFIGSIFNFFFFKERISMLALGSSPSVGLESVPIVGVGEPRFCRSVFLRRSPFPICTRNPGELLPLSLARVKTGGVFRKQTSRGNLIGGLLRLHPGRAR